MNLQCIENICKRSLNILSDYYQFNCIPEIKNFIFPPCYNYNGCSRILFEETEKDLFIAFQFENQIFDEIGKLQNLELDKYLSIQTVSVISEESSHFKLILDAVEYKSQLSILEIETIGEIDRFLCLMHWNQKNQKFMIQETWRNIHDICDYVFQGNRFKSDHKELYIAAENKAFHHLKKAFEYDWDSSFYNFSKINLYAAHYLKTLREKYLKN